MPLQWIKKPAKKPNLVIFVHGLSGGADTFKNSTGLHYCDLFSVDVSATTDFANFIYSSRLLVPKFVLIFARCIRFLGINFDLKKNKGIATYAKLLATELDALPINYARVHLVCHSMGGLVAKHALLECSLNTREKIGLYSTFATPHRGSVLAAAGGNLNPHVAEMIPNSEFIVNLEDHWQKVSPSHCRAECHFVGVYDEFVPETSAKPRGASNVYHLDGSHTAICKPHSRQDPGVSLLEKHLTSAMFLTPEPESVAGDPLFISYTPSF